MKKIYLLLILACFAMSSAYSQTTSGDKNSASTVDPRIKEVYADQLQTLVLNVPNRLRDLNDILQNRVKIEKSPMFENEKFVKLSSIELFNKYNPNLVRDIDINEANFNPLKYVLIFHADYQVTYRVDNTDKIIVIYPQQFLKNK